MYWLVSLPFNESDTPDRVWSRLQELTTYNNDYSVNFKFRLPDNIRVGTLDSLLTLSDDLTKVNSAVEGTVNKIRRQLYDLQSSLPVEERSEVLVEDGTPEAYLQRFQWNEAKYPSRRPPKETVTAIMDTVQKLDEDLKVRMTEYSQARTSLQAMLRKYSGSLAVRDLTDLVPRQRVIATENLTTLVVIVPKAARSEFLTKYEGLSDMVVPRSSFEIAEDADYIAFGVVVFRRVVDECKQGARTAGYQAKELSTAALIRDEGESSSNGAREMNGETQKSDQPDSQAVVQKLKEDVEERRSALVEWCLTSYGEAFSNWVHITSIRLFVESILRYGLPPQFLPVLMKPHQKGTGALRKVLAQNFGGVGGHHFAAEGGGGGAGEDLYPYVSFTLNIDEHS